MDPVREDRHLDRAYGVYISFGQARAAYYNVYYIRAARSAVYNIRAAPASIDVSRYLTTPPIYP